MLQAEDRVHRIGQKNMVDIRYIIAENTVDEMMWNLLQSKTTHTSHMLDGKAKKLEADELDTILTGGADMNDWVNNAPNDEVRLVSTGVRDLRSRMLGI